MSTPLQKRMLYNAWLRANVGYPLAFLLLLFGFGCLFIHDNPKLFFTVFGTGDPLLMGFLILVGVLDDADVYLMKKAKLDANAKLLLSIRDFLQYASIAALICSFMAKYYALSEHETHKHFESLVPLMNVAIAGLLFCVCAAIWLKRGLLSQI